MSIARPQQRALLVIDAGYAVQPQRRPANLCWQRLITAIEEEVGVPFYERWWYGAVAERKAGGEASFYRQLKQPAEGPSLRVVLRDMKVSTCKKCHERAQVQKGVDVAIATLILKHCYTNACDTVVLFAGDGDFEECLRIVHDELRKRVVIVAYQGKNANDASLSADISQFGNPVIYVENLGSRILKDSPRPASWASPPPPEMPLALRGNANQLAVGNWPALPRSSAPAQSTVAAPIATFDPPHVAAAKLPVQHAHAPYLPPRILELNAMPPNAATSLPVSAGAFVARTTVPAHASAPMQIQQPQPQLLQLQPQPARAHVPYASGFVAPPAGRAKQKPEWEPVLKGNKPKPVKLKPKRPPGDRSHKLAASLQLLRNAVGTELDGELAKPPDAPRPRKPKNKHAPAATAAAPTVEEEKEWEEFDAEAEEAEEEEAEEGPGPNWQCKECTFINEVAEVLECGMCSATWTPPSEAEPGQADVNAPEEPPEPQLASAALAPEPVLMDKPPPQSSSSPVALSSLAERPRAVSEPERYPSPPASSPAFVLPVSLIPPSTPVAPAFAPPITSLSPVAVSQSIPITADSPQPASSSSSSAPVEHEYPCHMCTYHRMAPIACPVCGAPHQPEKLA